MKNKALSLLVLLLTLGVGLGVGETARAQSPIALETLANGGSTLTYNGITFTVTSCTFKDGGSNHNGTPCTSANDNFYLAPDPSAPTTSVIVEALNGGANGSQVPIFSYTQGTSPTGTYDLSVTLSAVPANGTISSAAETLDATAPSSIIANDPNDVHASETFNNATICNGGTGLKTTLQTTTQSCTFTPQTSLSVSKDFGLAVNGLTNGSTIALNSVVENFAHAPEPSSLAMLLPAILVLGWAYRRKVHH